MKRLALALAFVVALISPAAAQPQLTNLPSGTVIGRLLTGSGPAQAIPLATLLTNQLNGLCTTNGATVLYNSTNGLWECSTAISAGGGPASLFLPNSGLVSGANSPAGFLIQHGSNANPVTGGNLPTVEISRIENITNGVSSGDGSLGSAFRVDALTTGTQQLNGFKVSVQTNAPSFGNSNDTVSVYGSAISNGTCAATELSCHAYASFFSAGGIVTHAGAIAVGTNILNNSGANHLYNASLTPQLYTGVDLVYDGSVNSWNGGQGVVCRNSGASGGTGKWDSCILAMPGGVVNNFLRDESSAVTSYLIDGSHTNGINLSAGTFSGNQILGIGFNFANTGTLTVNPAGPSTSQGLAVTTVGTTSSTAGPVSYNIFTGTLQGTVTGSGTDAYGNKNTDSVNLRVNTTVAAAVSEAGVGGLFATRVTTTSSVPDIVSLASTFYANVAMTTTGFSEAFNSVATVDSSGSTTTLISAELGVAINSGGSATNRFAAVLTSSGASNGGTRDAALGVIGQGSSFNNFILWSNLGSTAPISTTGNFFAADTTYTIANFITAPTMNVTGNILGFSAVSLAGSGLLTITGNSIGTTSTDRILLENFTAAAAGAQQWSPRIHLIGQGWKTNATAASQTVDWIAEVQPNSAVTGLQGAAQPFNDLVFSAQTNGGGYTAIVAFTLDQNNNAGLIFNSPSGKNANIQFQDAAANKWYVQNSGSNDSFNIISGDTSGNVTILTIVQASGLLELPNLTTDATHTDRTVCQDTTSKGIYFGSGAAGICLGTSSARFKHDIGRLAAGLDEIMKLDAFSYRLNSDHGDPDKLLYGFTAEQGIGALPDLVGLDSQGRPQTFDYMGVVPVLVRAVQELKADNDNLRAELMQIRRAVIR